MKILLINPPFYRFIGLEQDYVPLSLLAVGSQIKQDGHDVYLKNFEVGVTSYAGYADRAKNFSLYQEAVSGEHQLWDDVRATIEQIKPDKVGITVLSAKMKSALRIIDIANEMGVGCVVGGPHVNIDADFPRGTQVVKGEFESHGRERIKDLDSLPESYYDMLLDSYSPSGYAHIVSSRGCPFRCRFCASNTVWNNKVTYKSASRILMEMKTIKDRFNPSEFVFWDETFTINKRRLKEFCSAYDIDATWNCDTRADTLDDETLAMMKGAGCGHISIGIESGNDRILRYINKGETTDDFRRVAELLNKHGIQWKAYCIIGFPEETAEDMMQSLEFIKSLNPFRITLSFFTPYKGTSLYDECASLGLVDNYDPSMFAHQSPNNYFCPKVDRETFETIKNKISADIDVYNKTAIEHWR